MQWWVFSWVLVNLHTYLVSYWLIYKSASQYAKSLISNEPVIVLKRLTLSTWWVSWADGGKFKDLDENLELNKLTSSWINRFAAFFLNSKQLSLQLWNTDNSIDFSHTCELNQGSWLNTLSEKRGEVFTLCCHGRNIFGSQKIEKATKKKWFHTFLNFMLLFNFNECVVLENIHTLPTESRGVEGGHGLKG